MGFLARNVARLAEAAFVGLLGTAELAAIAFNFPIVMGLGAASRGLGIGATSVVARAMGSRDHARSAILVSHCMWLTLLFTLLCLALTMPHAAALFTMLGASEDVLPFAVEYFLVWMIGLPLFALAMVTTTMLRATGDARTPGYLQTFGAILQIALTPILVFGWIGVPALGVVGAALAHVISQGISYFLALYVLVARDHLVVMTLRGILSSWREILHVGLPAAATNLIGPASTGIITRLLADYGPAVVAAFGVATRVDSMVTMVLISLGGATAPFIGQNWGAALYDRVREALRLSYRFCLAWGVFAGILMAIIGGPLVALVNDDPEVVEAAAVFFLIVPFSVGFMGMNNVATSSFNALGKPIPPLVLSINRMLVIYVPMAMLGSHLFGYIGIFAATALANVLNGLAAAYWNRLSVNRAIMSVQPHAKERMPQAGD
jgi:putative MATE family efflux protein